ncbi:hypothetical protein KAH37_07995, partial [bacterium]|nr:hypothetical protein [bacterium]
MTKTTLLLMILLFTGSLFGAASFAEAKNAKGSAVTWTFYVEDGRNVSRAKKMAMKQLKKEGYKRVSAPLASRLNKGHFAVLFTSYWVKGVLRNAYVYGFSSKSQDDAKAKAEKNLKKLKGWKASEGFAVNKLDSFGFDSVK